ncbi:periplasmic heavy metal sensor [Sphingobium scionense]
MSSRTLRIVLIVSLILNVFVIGGVVGAAIMWKRVDAQRPLAGIGRPARLRQAVEALAPENRRALRQAVRAAAQSLKPEVERARGRGAKPDGCSSSPSSTAPRSMPRWAARAPPISPFARAWKPRLSTSRRDFR